MYKGQESNSMLYQDQFSCSYLSFTPANSVSYPINKVKTSSIHPRAAAMKKTRFLLVTFPAYGQINPALQFAKRLLHAGAGEVTFPATASTLRRMNDSDIPDGLVFAKYSDDGYEDAFEIVKGDVDRNVLEHQRRCSETLADLIVSAEHSGRRFSCLIYTTHNPWAGRVAREHHVPSALLWIQPAAVFDIYYYFFNGYGDVVKNSINDPSCRVKLPGLPLLSGPELPSYLFPSYGGFALPAIQEQMQLLREEESNPKVLVNTFDELEVEALVAIDGLDMIAVGPLTPSSDKKEPSRTSPCMEWLNSKLDSSVIYVSFGSYLVPPKAQMEEIVRALLKSGKPFLWVNRALEDDQKGGKEEEGEVVSCREELEKEGMIVPWCSQLGVLSHPAVGCFVTHCGWNSTLESLVSGVPVVAFPLWTDQATNAKLIEDMWEIGVRVRANEEGVVESGEIGRCLEMVMGEGERREELKRNGLKWKEMAREAVGDGGSSAKNLEAFVKGYEQV